MTIRTITGTVLQPDGTAYSDVSISFMLKEEIISSSVVVPIYEVKIITNSSGVFSVDLYVPDTGTCLYTVILHSGNSQDISLGAGSSIDLSTLLSIAASSSTPDALQVVIDAHVAGADPHTRYQLKGTTSLNLGQRGLNFDPVIAPSAPVAALIVTGTGNVDNGTHIYKVTFLNSEGETELSSASNTVTVDASNKQVGLTVAVSTESGVVSRKIYRSKATHVDAFAPMHLLTTLDNNVDTTYTDNIADADLGADDYCLHDNTTGGYIFMNDVPAGYIGKRWDTSFGNGALANNTFGGGNAAIGYQALNANTTGRLNVAIGFNALKNNTSGGYNNGIGDSALFGNTSGSFNVGIGWQTLVNNTTGILNTAVGYGAGGGNTYDPGTGAENAAFGNMSLNKLAGGESNSAVGGYALGRLTTGNFNTAIGFYAGYSVTTLGYGVFLGNKAGYHETGANRLYIDNAARVNEADGRLKALIYGIFSEQVENQYLTFNAGNMGFFGHVAAAQPTKAGNNNWANLSDLLTALASIGLIDTA